MRKILLYLLECVLSNFRSHAALQLKVIVLRHQLEVLRRTRPARVRLTRLDRMFWLFLYRLRPGCLDAVAHVKPGTVIAWRRKGLSCLLDLEITSTATRPPTSPCGSQDTDPARGDLDSWIGTAAGSLALLIPVSRATYR